MSQPRGLKARGASLWRDISENWTLRHDEIRILEHACRTADELERLQQALACEQVVVLGSQGQTRANPLAAEVRKHRELLARLLRQLELPDLPAGAGEVAGPSARSEKARAAANTRWARVREIREGVTGG